MLEPQYQLSAEFLERWRPGGPWVLTAVGLDKKSIVTETFTKQDAVLEWLERYGADYNLYFSVNPTTRAVSKKASREDVASMDWLHVDIDPRKGEDPEEERARMLSLLQNPPEGVPQPTVVVDSGGGYWGFWRLREPFRVDGERERYDEALRYNLNLELKFGADSCHNVDRIARLPGTVNRPDAKKRKRGRVEALSTVVSWRDVAFDLEGFDKAPAPGSRKRALVSVSNQPKRLASVDDLPKSVSRRCRLTIVQGSDPDDSGRHESRSEWLRWVCCELVRCGLSDDEVFGIITDPRYRISESVLDKGRGADRYAIRQIQRAREHAIDPHLAEMNEKHAVVGDVHGRCRVLSRTYDQMVRRWVTSYQSFQDVVNRYAHLKIEYQGKDRKGEPVVKTTSVGRWWLDCRYRRQYDAVTFSPGKSVEGVYNTWEGWAVEPDPNASCEKFLQHVRDNVCSGNSTYYEYLLDWMAKAVQEPWKPGQVAVVLRGLEGTGKGFFVNAFGRLFGNHYIHIANLKHLTGNFNAHLGESVLVFADEAFSASDKKHVSTLKSLITESTIAIEGKGQNVRPAANCTHIMMASNDDWVVVAGLRERRFLVLDVGDAKIQDSAYFDALQEELSSGGYEALLYALQSRDISKFDVRRVPRTKALVDQRVQSLGIVEQWWFEKLSSGDIFEGEGWPSQVYSARLSYDFGVFVTNFSKKPGTLVGRFMAKALPGGKERKFREWGKLKLVGSDGREKTMENPLCYELPPLEECRRHFDENFGGPFEWETLETRSPVPEKLPFLPEMR